DTKALQCYKQAAALEDFNYIAWLNIGDAQRRLGHPGAAKTAYLKGFDLTSAHLQTNPSSYVTRAYMAYAEARLGQKDNAKNEIVQALQSPDKDKQIVLTA